jgi:hypothetical protein
MGHLSELKQLMTKHCVPQAVVELVFGINFSDVTDNDAARIKNFLIDSLTRQHFDDGWFAGLARSLGYDETSIAIAGSVETSHSVLSMFEPMNF